MISKPNDKLGFYTVGSQRVESKIDACILGTELNQHPQWHFSDNVWNSVDWTAEPEMDILEIYKQRARQIRAQYEYVIVNYSAGSDSQTLVEAFVKAGCHIDEIVTIWNRSQTSNVVLSPGATDARNIEAEFDLTTKDGLNWIKSVSPTTKITYMDISSAVVDSYKQFDGEEWLNVTTEHLHPQYVTRWHATREKHQLQQLDRGKKTAIVFGIDKPRVCIKDDRYCVYFIDIIANIVRGAFNDPSYTNLDYVYFYWTPDMPEIVIKQAHLIKKWFESNPALKPILQWPNIDFTKRATYEIIVRSIIYPEWDLKKFQCAKTSSSVFCEWDDWFFQQYSGTAIYDSWYKGIEYVQAKIDSKYLKYTFDQKFDGFTGMINGHFYI